MPLQTSLGKLTPQKQHALIQKYNISIEGPIRSHDWPRNYASLFGLVRDIEKIRYEEYYQADLENDNQRLLHVAQMRNRVSKLVSQAHRLRESLDNEETWRLETEHLVLERFTTEVDWWVRPMLLSLWGYNVLIIDYSHVCGQRRWLSDFQALPSCPSAAAELQCIRQGRRLCCCEEILRAKLLAEPFTQPAFVTKASCTIVDKSMPEIQRRILAHHKPDRVLGLGRTDEMKGLLATSPNITATVTKDGMNAYFPFLVLEAKSEKNTVGFESVERQTAFPIRTMVNIQKALETASAGPLDPLRIIDLWHGCILRHDSALQLFLIIDLICDWARDIFIDHVLRCLRQCASPRLSVAHPDLSPSSISDGEFSLSSERQRIPPTSSDTINGHQVSITPDPADVVMDEVPNAPGGDISMVGTSSLVLFSGADLNTSENAPGEELSESPDILRSWRQLVSIKSDKDVQLTFRRISLPETMHELHSVIRALAGDTDLIESAQMVLALLSPDNPFIITSDFVNRLQRAWGKPSPDPPAHDEPLLYASLTWRASFDYVDWVLTKELSCITATPTAMAKLTIIGRASSGYLFPEGGLQPTTLGKRLIHPLRYLPAAELIQAASRNQTLHLQIRLGCANPAGWIEDHEKSMHSRHLWDCLDSNPEAFSQCAQNVYSSVRGTPPDFQSSNAIDIPLPLQVPEIAKERPIALLKKPGGIVDSLGPPYSIFSFNREDAECPSVIGNAVRSFLRDGFGCFYGNNEPLSVDDRMTLAAVVEDWAKPNLSPASML
ncbi:hypothetical protein FE257_008708 [Aspergillus nanangensis]|uniref:Uncharacterized protein n=1 Tax=Aspergillus nanangensis TaxID=2582783 RepID=A0AAD4GTA1_ASPNN|nr:hypothetical protein FE257_008708 [Aspergillus nanangensis]